jgi:hypothetical protein
MAVIRTRRLGVAHITVAGTGVSVYECPAGRRGILRDIWIKNRTDTEVARVTVDLYLSGGSIIGGIFDGPLQPQEAHHVVCDTCLEAGDSLQSYSSAADVTLWASGAELDIT